MNKRTVANNKSAAVGVAAVNNDFRELRCSMKFILQREVILAMSGHGAMLPWLSIAMVPNKAKSVVAANRRRMNKARVVFGNCMLKS